MELELSAIRNISEPDQPSPNVGTFYSQEIGFPVSIVESHIPDPPTPPGPPEPPELPQLPQLKFSMADSSEVKVDLAPATPVLETALEFDRREDIEGDIIEEVDYQNVTIVKAKMANLSPPMESKGKGSNTSRVSVASVSSNNTDDYQIAVDSDDEADGKNFLRSCYLSSSSSSTRQALKAEPCDDYVNSDLGPTNISAVSKVDQPCDDDYVNSDIGPSSSWLHQGQADRDTGSTQVGDKMEEMVVGSSDDLYMNFVPAKHSSAHSKTNYENVTLEMHKTKH